MDYKDFMEEMEQNILDRKNSPWYKRIPLNVGESLWYGVILQIKDLPQKIKWKYQSITRGYSDADVWGLNHFIVNTLREPFHKFYLYETENGKSLPPEFATDPAGWLVVLSKIDYAFEHEWREDNELGYYDNFLKDMSPNESKIHQDKISEGFKLLGIFLRNLWD